MSEIPPTFGHGASAPAEPARTPRLSDEAERILQRRGRFVERNVARIISRLNISTEHDAIRQENEIVLDALRDRAGEPSVTEAMIERLKQTPFYQAIARKRS